MEPKRRDLPRERGDRGFTLAELLVVISVLGVISGVVVVAIGGISDRGTTASCASDARALRGAVETYRAKRGVLPADQAALVTEGLLSKVSTLNDFTVASNTVTYTQIGTCTGATTTTAAAVAQPGTYRATVMADKPIAYFRLGEAPGVTVASDASGNGRNGTYSSSVQRGQAGALTNDSDTAANFAGAPVTLTNLPVDATNGAATTVEFWMKWNGTSGVMPFGWQVTDLWFQYGGFGFNNGCSNVEGVSASGFANRWVHVVAVWTSGDLSKSKLYIDGKPVTLSHLGGSAWTACANNAKLGPNARISGWVNDGGYQYRGVIDDLAIYNGELSATRVAAHYAAR